MGDKPTKRTEPSSKGDDPLLKMRFHDPCRSNDKVNDSLSSLLHLSPKETIKNTRRPKLHPPPVAKRQKTNTAMSPPSSSPDEAPLLHQSCRLFPTCADVIKSAFDMEPQAACQRAKSVRKGNNSLFLVGDGREPFSLPINILLLHNASLDVVKVAAKFAPEALILPDGRNDCCSLIIALRLCGGGKKDDSVEKSTTVNSSFSSSSIPEELLAANPKAAQIPDKRRNFPLHVATYVGASFSIINKLYYANPEALMETNFSGETPLDIAIRNGKCCDETTDFLQEKMDHLKAARLRNRQAKKTVASRGLL